MEMEVKLRGVQELTSSAFSLNLFCIDKSSVDIQEPTERLITPTCS